MKAAAAPAAKSGKPESTPTVSVRHAAASHWYRPMTDETPAPGIWDTPQNILVILAHPDDPEFFCGATLARWARAGHQVIYYLLTCGDKGYNDSTSAGHDHR